MSSSCILDNATFVCSYAPIPPAPGLEKFISFFTTPEWIHFYRSLAETDVELARQYAHFFFLYVVMPIFCSYLWSPARPQVNVYVPDKGPILTREGEPEPEDGLDSISKDILQDLRRRPGGTTAKMLYNSLKAYDSELEMFDVYGRLYNLSQANLITSFVDTHTAPKWVAY